MKLNQSCFLSIDALFQTLVGEADSKDVATSRLEFNLQIIQKLGIQDR